MHFFNSVLQEALIPTYRILDGNGKVIEDAVLPEVSERYVESRERSFGPY